MKKTNKKAKIAPESAYNRFVKEYKAGLQGEKFDNKKCAAAWKARQLAPLKQVVAENKAEELVTASTETLEIVQQEGPIVSEKAEPPQALPEQTAPATLPPPSERVFTPIADEEMYTFLAEAGHGLVANLTEMFSGGRIVIPQEKLGKLNKYLGMIIKKYDTSGKIGQFSPEIAYGLGLADLVTLMYADWQREQAKKKREQGAVTAPTTPELEVSE